MDTCVPSSPAERNNFSAATRRDTSIPPEPGSGVRPRSAAPEPPRKKPKEKPDGTRITIAVDEALSRAFPRSQKAVADYLMKRTGGGFPGYAALDFARTLRTLGLSRRRFYEIAALLRSVLIVRVQGEDLFVFSELAAWSATRNEKKRLLVWLRTLRRLRTRPRPPVLPELEEWWRRASAGGPRLGFAGTLEKWVPTQAQVPCGKPVDNSVEKAVGSATPPPPPARSAAVLVRAFSEQYPPNCPVTPPSTDPLPISSSLDPHFEKSLGDLGSSSFSGNTREQAHPPAGSERLSEPADAPERQEGESEFHSPVRRPRKTGPPPLPGDGHMPAPRDTETRDQGAPGIQGSPRAREGLYVSPGRTDRITYPAFEYAFVTHMRRVMPRYWFIRTSAAVACMRTVWERWCAGKPLRWLDPWMAAQVHAFTQIVREDSYQAQGFLRHMRAAAVFVPIPGPDGGPKKPRPPDDGAARETREDVARILRESLISHRTG